ncbi:LLM class flavin-dependent oxidoreductase [Baekduia soli]|uniref:LLM class flavin-dependent oxidoreductase n=1 Tax=Baekduia soli TaxID=496014 RepID=A0A5B8U2J7_9ACTN|nr:LLM class flavin-dependent oxidoreductase [Baekduia soli]QEC47279.1 LLM class flavin-dependent oxidoreductase [Baekduia soli]
MKIGAHFKPEDFPTYLESVRKADEAGYDRAWLIDSQMLWQDVYVYMAQGLASTRSLTFGTAVTNTLTRHFSIAASANATLAEIWPGRVILGLGRGDSGVRTLGLKPVKTKDLAAAVPLVRALMAGEEVQVPGGGMTHLRWAEGGREVPIMMAATGPKNLSLAGALADIVMLYVGTSPAGVAWAIDKVRQGAEEAGRDPAEVEISLLCAMWVSDDQQEAWDRCRWAPAACANHLADAVRFNPDLDMPEEVLRLLKARDDYDYFAGHLDSSADHAGYLTGELIDDFAIAGDAEKCLARIRELGDLGVQEISCAYLNGEAAQMERVGSDIVPRVNAIHPVR